MDSHNETDSDKNNNDILRTIAYCAALLQKRLIMLEQTIYHYTSSSSLCSIISDDGIKFWASDTRCMNDLAEGNEGLLVYRRTVQSLYKRRRISNEFYNSIINIAPDPGPFYYRNSNDVFVFTDTKQYNNYICCFSKDPDNLAMWNYYLKGSRYEGYCIGIHSLELKECLNDYFGTGVTALLLEVMYVDDEKERTVSDELLCLYNLYQQVDEICSKAIIDSLREILWFWTLQFKSHYFMHEKEIRLIVRTSKTDRCLQVDNKLVLHHRTNNGLLIPYYSIPLTKYSLASITLAPSNSPDTEKATLISIMQEYLNDLGYNSDAVALHISNIPVRF